MCLAAHLVQETVAKRLFPFLHQREVEASPQLPKGKRHLRNRFQQTNEGDGMLAGLCRMTPIGF